MSAIAVDSPDGQRNVVSAQLLLAANGLSEIAEPFGVPPNAQSIVALLEPGSPSTFVSCTGQTTGAQYPGIPIYSSSIPPVLAGWVFDAAPAADPVVLLAGGAPSGTECVVYADSATHTSADTSKLTSYTGLQYIIPAAPSTVSGDHPPVELAVGSFAVTAGGVVLAAPGSAERYRIFAIEMAAYQAAAGNIVARVYRTTNGTVMSLLAVGGSADGAGRSFTQFPLTGVPIGTNESLSLAYDAGSGNQVRGVVTYTKEIP